MQFPSKASKSLGFLGGVCTEKKFRSFRETFALMKISNTFMFHMECSHCQNPYNKSAEGNICWYVTSLVFTSNCLIINFTGQQKCQWENWQMMEAQCHWDAFNTSNSLESLSVAIFLFAYIWKNYKLEQKTFFCCFDLGDNLEAA